MFFRWVFGLVVGCVSFVCVFVVAKSTRLVALVLRTGRLEIFALSHSALHYSRLEITELS